ncbi:MAG: hypothetical protein Q9219_001205 [cf. Caloplaca sp. 3 TL-2023]
MAESDPITGSTDSGLATDSRGEKSACTNPLPSTTQSGERNTKPDNANAMAVEDADTCKDTVEMAGVQKPFNFMGLPPEIRQMIYKELLVAPTEIFIRGAWWDETICRFEYGIPKALPSVAWRIFHVSKAIFNEAIPVYLGFNTFAFACLDDLSALNKLSVESRRAIRRLIINFSGWPDATPARSISILRSCTALRDLSFRIGQGHVLYNPRHPLSIHFPLGLNDLLKIRGIEKLSISRLYPDNDYTHDVKQHLEDLITKMQVLKQPYSAAAIRNQDLKDYGPTRAKRTRFGLANVVTRYESKAMTLKNEA